MRYSASRERAKQLQEIKELVLEINRLYFELTSDREFDIGKAIKEVDQALILVNRILKEKGLNV